MKPGCCGPCTQGSFRSPTAHARADVQGCLMGLGQSVSTCWGQSRLAVLLLSPLGPVDLSSFFPPTPTVLRSTTCSQSTFFLGGGQRNRAYAHGRCSRISGDWVRGRYVGLEHTPRLWLWSISACGQYVAFTSRGLSAFKFY